MPTPARKASAPAAKKSPAQPAKKTAPAKRAASSSKTASPKTKKAPDAIALLKADHREVKALFKAYDKQVKAKGEPNARHAIAQEICAKLTAHATAEEELFYPAARTVLKKDSPLVDEADVEHASAKALIAQIEAGSPMDPLYDAKVKVLGEYIEHHVKEEEGEMFPKISKSPLDLRALGAELAARKAELLA